jgi:regulator of protease activity HflC (stomatin/prohibitin superfamily)
MEARSMLGLTKTFYIKASERGLLYYRDDFQRVLPPGTYTRSAATRWNVKTFDLNEAEAPIEDLELLLQTHGPQLAQALTIVRTQFNEVALIRVGQVWTSLAPNRLRAYWKGFIDVEVHLFDIEADPQLPAEFMQRISGSNIPGTTICQVAESEMGLLYIQNNFVRPLAPGKYGFWVHINKIAVNLYDRTLPTPQFPVESVLIDNHPEFIASTCEVVEPGSNAVAIVRDRGKVVALLPPCSRKLFWKGVTIEQIDIAADSKLPDRLVSELTVGRRETLSLSHELLHVQEVPAQHVGLVHINGVLSEPLAAGLHAWWLFGRSFTSQILDLRLQDLEVSGQEILTKDKVPLRLNLTAGYRILDPVRATTALADISGFLYKELQFALRGAIGSQTLDSLLDNKGAIDQTIADYIRGKCQDYGIEVDSVGVKDIILPGEIKAILSKVVEAEKAAQANVVRRREETAATRSMLNTAKVMEDSPIALRLRELEILERIAEKIEHINVNGSLDSILTDLIRFNGPSGRE